MLEENIQRTGSINRTTTGYEAPEAAEIREYIYNNPFHWVDDEYHPQEQNKNGPEPR
jgi:hypothetical protein